MALTATFAADMSKFIGSLEKAQVKLQVFDRATKTAVRDLSRDMANFSGQKVAAEAARMAEAVQRVGGASKLTEAEQRRVNATMTEAVAKYRALGQEAPANIQRLATETKKAEQATTGFGASLLKMSGAFALANVATRALESLGRAVVDFARDAVGQAVTESTKMTAAMLGLRSVATAFGQDADKAKEAAVKLASDGLMTVGQAAGGLKNLLATRLNLDQAVNLMNAFKDSAAFGRQAALSYGEAIVSATEGIKNQNSITTDNAGVTKNLSIILKEAGYRAEDLGRVTTDAGVRLALYNGLLKETAAFSGDAARLAQTYSGQISRLDTAYSMFLATLGAAITENQTVAEVLRLVGDEIVKVNTEATNGGKAFQVVSDAIVGVVRAGAELLSWLDYAQTGMNGLVMVGAELAAATVNLAGIVVSATKAFIEYARWLSPATFQQNTETVKNLGDVLSDLEKDYNKLTDVSNKAIDRSATWGNALQEQAARLRAMAVELEKTRGKTVQYGEATGRVGETAAKAEGQTKAALSAMAKEFKATQKVSAEAWKNYSDNLNFMGLRWMQEAEENAKRSKAHREFIVAEVNAVDQALRKLGAKFERPEMDFVSMSALMQNYTTDPSAGMAAAKSFSDGFKKEIGSALGDVTQIIVDVIAQDRDWRIAARAITARVGGAIGTAVGAYFGGPGGAAAGGALGSGLGAWIGGIFGDTASEKVQESVRRRMGMAIDEGMAQAIHDVAKNRYGGNVKAGMAHMMQQLIAADGGLNPENLSAFRGLLTSVFDMFANGVMSASEATNVLNSNWQAFVDVYTDGSGRVGAELQALIERMRALGLEVQAVSDWMQEQASAAIDGTNAIINASKGQFDAYSKIADGVKKAQEQIDELNKVEARGRGAEWQREMAQAQADLTKALTDQHRAAEGAGKELENLGYIAMGAYAAAVASGMSHNEAIKAALPGVKQLIKAYEDLGIDVEGAGLKAFLAQANFADKIPEVLAGLDGLAQSMIGLSNMKLLTPEMFSRMQAAGMSMYDKLLAEAQKYGLQGDEATRAALVPMQDYLRQAAEQAELLGVPLDENTQRLIDQSKALGIWKDKSVDPAKKMFEAIEKIVGILDELTARLLNLPPRVNTTVNTDYTSTGTPPGGSGGSGGSGGGNDTNNVSRPTQGGVTPTSGPSLTSLPSSGGDGTPIVIKVPVIMDGREVAMAVAPHRISSDRRWGV